MHRVDSPKGALTKGHSAAWYNMWAMMMHSPWRLSDNLLHPDCETACHGWIMAKPS